MVCSIFKTVELKNITGTKDPTWSSVNLSIWSGAELQVGIFIASLPPLRKAFDRFFHQILPGSSTGGAKSNPGYGTPGQNYGSRSAHGNDFRMDTLGKGNRSAHKSYLPGESALDSDSESEKAILDEEERRMAGSGIMKTTGIVITETRTGRHDSTSGSV